MFRKFLAALAVASICAVVHAQSVGQPNGQLQKRLNGITSTNSTPGVTLQSSNLTVYSTATITTATISNLTVTGSSSLTNGFAAGSGLNFSQVFGTTNLFFTNGVLVGHSP